MQIIPIANFDATAGSAVAKESLPDDPDSQYSFSAQMGQALNSLTNQATATSKENVSTAAPKADSDKSAADHGAKESISNPPPNAASGVQQPEAHSLRKSRGEQKQTAHPCKSVAPTSRSAKKSEDVGPSKEKSEAAAAPTVPVVIPENESLDQKSLSGSAEDDAGLELSAADGANSSIAQKLIVLEQLKRSAGENGSDAEAKPDDLGAEAATLANIQPSGDQKTSEEKSAASPLDGVVAQIKKAQADAQNTLKLVDQQPLDSLDFKAAMTKANADQASLGEKNTTLLRSALKNQQKAAQTNNNQELSGIADTPFNGSDGTVQIATNQDQSALAKGNSAQSLNLANLLSKASKAKPEQNASKETTDALPADNGNAQPNIVLSNYDSDKAQGQQDQAHKESAFSFMHKNGEGEKVQLSADSLDESGSETMTPFSSGGTRTAGSNDAKQLDSPQAPKTDSSFIDQLADRMRIQVKNGGGEIQISLKPDSLGRLEIKAETTANGVIAQISAGSEKVKNYLESNMHVLQQSFHDQGIKVDRINVVIQNDSDHQSMAGNTGSGGSGQQSKSSSKKSNMLFSQSSDELAVDPLAWTAMNPNARFHTVA